MPLFKKKEITVNTMLKLSEGGSLAIHALALLASLGKREKLSAGKISAVFNVSRNHLSKIMQQLVREKLVISDRGPGGGFCLAKPSSEIRLIEIYKIMEGKQTIKGCLLEKKFCFGEKCVLGKLLFKINNDIYNYFSETRLRDIAITIDKKEKINRSR
jgi:Rrf2 family protein